MELLPIEHRGQYNLAMWTAMVMKLPPGTETIDLEHFTVQFRDSMDTTDTAESIIPKVRAAPAPAPRATLRRRTPGARSL